MNKVFLGSLIIFAITALLYIGYWFGANQDLYNETRIAVWEWCADTNNFIYCSNECHYYDQQCEKLMLDLGEFK